MKNKTNYQHTRLELIKRFISIEIAPTHHIKITARFRGRTIKQLTSIHANLTEFEKNCILIHVYKVLANAENNRAAKHTLGNCNYARVFGTPWELKQ